MPAIGYFTSEQSAPLHAAPPVLGKLEYLCNQFNDVCQTAQRQSDPDEDFLTLVKDKLWTLTSSICAEAADLEKIPALHELLLEFQHQHFRPKVLKWYRMNKEFDRLWSKPAGYSGDYHTIELLCRNEPPLICFEDIFLNHLVQCTMSSQHWQKVLEHTKFLLRVLETGTADHPVRILDAGCGPSHDVREAMRWLQHDSKGEIILTDLDPKALQFSRSKLKNSRHGIEFTFVQEDVLKTIRRLLQQGEGGTFDGIIFGGLFDYISDRVIRLILKQARQLLKSDGEMLFSQVSKDNPDRTFMKWFGDWSLIERNEADLSALCAEAEIAPEQVRMWRERSNCAILCHVANHGPPKYLSVRRQDPQAAES